MRSKLFILAIVLFASATLGALSVDACTCVARTTCQFASTADVIFVGKILDSTETTRKVIRRERPIGGEWEEVEHTELRQVSRVLVEEPFLGTEGKKEIVIETETSSSCGLSLAESATYLIYAGQDDKEPNLMTHMCSGTKLLESAAADLAYLRDNKDSGATIKGKVGFGQAWKLDPKPLARYGVNAVHLSGPEGQLDANLKEDGSYSFPKLKAGTYSLRLIIPDTLITPERYDFELDKTLPSDERRITLNGRGCVVEDFFVKENGRIDGRVTNAKGEPVDEVTVYAVPVTPTGKVIKQEEGCYDTGLCVDSDENGRYSFKGLLAGTYHVGVRLGDYICNDCVDAEFQKTLYPGVAAESSAKIVTVKTGRPTAGIDFKLTRTYVEREVKGHVFFKDGRPAANVQVRYVVRTPDLKKNGITFIKTDAAGYFSFAGYENHSYLIGAFTDQRDGNEKMEAAGMVLKVLPNKKLTEIKLVLDRTNVDALDYWEFPTKGTARRN